MRITKPMWAEIIKMIPISAMAIIFICCLIFIPALNILGLILAGIAGVLFLIFLGVAFCCMAKDGFENLRSMWSDEQMRIEAQRMVDEMRRERERRELQQQNHIPDDHFRVD
jgi:hypothetical protein